MLLILTSSIDGHSEEIVRRVGSDNVFRFNVDQWRDYEFHLSDGGFCISDPAGRRCHDTYVGALYVRKPTFDDPIAVPIGGCLEEWLRAQINTFVQELYNICRDKGLVRLVEKGAQVRFGKFSQMRLAGKYFTVPPWRYVKTHGEIQFRSHAKVVTKPLTADFVSGSKFLYTREVDPASLDNGFPWLLQEKIEADADVTVVYVAGRCFAFALDRTSFDGVDWRKHINRQELDWRRVELPARQAQAIVGFMTEANLQFGRLDFLQKGETLHFLEVNPNGQWAWLDMDGSQGIFDCVVGELTRGWL